MYEDFEDFNNIVKKILLYHPFSFIWCSRYLLTVHLNYPNKAKDLKGHYNIEDHQHLKYIFFYSVQHWKR